MTKELYYQKYHLTNGLQQFVKYAWVMKSCETRSKPDLLIPDGYPEIIFVLNGAYSKEFLVPSKATVIIQASCIIGIQTHSVLARRMNNCHLIGLKLNPVGAHSLFGGHLKEMLDTNISLDALGVDWLCELDQRLQACTEDSTIIELLTEALFKQIKKIENHPSDELATSFLASILHVQGQISIQDLAQEHYLSIRHFQRRFKGFFGVSPKKFLNIIRFKHLYKSSILQQKRPDNFLEYGYYDQMHFIRDFRKHVGVNPSKSTESSFLQLNQMAQRNA